MKKNPTIVLTYGTFDLFHVGHLNLLERLRELGDKLIVGVSTDEFNAGKGKQSVYSFDERARIVEALSCVDSVIPENSWDQKEADIKKYQVSIFGMGDDWQGKFDELRSKCEVVYLPRTPSRSTTAVKESLAAVNKDKVEEVKVALDNLVNIINAIDG